MWTVCSSVFTYFILMSESLWPHCVTGDKYLWASFNISTGWEFSLSLNSHRRSREYDLGTALLDTKWKQVDVFWNINYLITAWQVQINILYLWKWMIHFEICWLFGLVSVSSSDSTINSTLSLTRWYFIRELLFFEHQMLAWVFYSVLKALITPRFHVLVNLKNMAISGTNMRIKSCQFLCNFDIVTINQGIQGSNDLNGFYWIQIAVNFIGLACLTYTKNVTQFYIHKIAWASTYRFDLQLALNCAPVKMR